MAIQSVSSNVSSYLISNTQSQQTQDAQQSQAVQENSEPRPEERVEKKEEAPKPVLNAQGQTTGTLINVVA